MHQADTPPEFSGAINAVSEENEGRKAFPLTKVDPTATSIPEFEIMPPKIGLADICLKCPVIRAYANEQSGITMTAGLRTGLNKTLAPFEGGRELAHRACSRLPGFDQTQFDREMVEGKRTDSQCFTCEQVKANGAACPVGGCMLPQGTTATTPIDLLSWSDCDLSEVGHTTIAKSIAISEFDNNLLIVQDKLYAYSNGYYAALDDRLLRQKALPHLGHKAKVSHASAIGEMIKLQSTEPTDGITPSPDHICFRNGTLNVATKAMELHSHANMLRNQIPHDYVATAECQNFLAFLNSVWQDDADRVGKIRLIRQWMGYLLVADTRMQKMLILHGNGQNGKSKLITLIEKVIGTDNKSSAMLARISNPDVRASMEGKLLNVSADLPKITITADGDLKAMITGDSIEASAKYQRSCAIRPYARFMVGTNHLPNCTDKSTAYTRRLMILTFNRKFEGNACNPNLLDTLTPEIPGIIAWAVEGLYDLREQGSFSEPPSSIAAVTDYHREIDPVKGFADACLEASGDTCRYKSKDLHAAFVMWCKAEGVPPESIQEFGRRMSALNYQSRKSDTTWWTVKPKPSAQRYFLGAQRSFGQANVDASTHSEPTLALAA